MTNPTWFGEFREHTKQILKDTHVVTSNFLGEQDWQWAKKSDVKFIEEMTTGTKFFFNHSNIQKRFYLGLFSSVYVFPYALGRMVYDGALNIYEYGKFRVNTFRTSTNIPKALESDAEQLLEKEDAEEKTKSHQRKPNGYVLGAPLAAPFIMVMAGFEMALRMAGVSNYGKHIIKAAGKRAANMSPYTRKVFGVATKESIQKDESVLTAKIKNGFDIADRFGFVTLPGMIAIAEFGFCAALTAMEFIGRYTLKALRFGGDYLRRALGFTEFGDNVMTIALKRMILMTPFTRTFFRIKGGVDDLKANLKKEQKEKLFSKPKEGWNSKNITDRIGFVTLPGAVAAIEMGFGVVITTIGSVWRMLGLNKFGMNIIAAAWKEGWNVLAYRFRGRFGAYSQDSIKKNHQVIFFKATGFWDQLYRGAFLTIPGAIALIEVSIASVIAGGLYTFEILGRSLGVSKRSIAGLGIISLAYLNLLGFPQKTNDEMKKAFKAPVRSWWDALDCIGTAFSGTVYGILVSAITVPLVVLGISKPNYDRFMYYLTKVRNYVKVRNGMAPDQAKEDKYNDLLKAHDQHLSGKIFSNINILNIVSHAIYYSVRFIVAPVLYVISRSISQFFGLIPLIETIHNAIYPTQYDVGTIEGFFKKRCDDLTLALNKEGRLPIADNAANIDIQEALGVAEKRNVFSRAGFTLFSEARKMIALGHTPDEKVIAVMKDKFADFMRLKKHEDKKGNKLDSNQFFSTIDGIKNPDQFSKDSIIKQIQSYFPNLKAQARIQKIAELLVAEFKLQVADKTDKSSMVKNN